MTRYNKRFYFNKMDSMCNDRLTGTTSENNSDLKRVELWQCKDFSKPGSNLRLGTVFSGIGAVEQALKRLGVKHNINFAGDIDPHVRKSYFQNYNIAPDRWHTDIRDFDAKPFKDQIDLLVGGSPCQSFSIIGKRLGLEDARGTLFYEFARVVKECQPKVFIYENVKGLLNHDKGRTWSIIQDIFAELGYDFYWSLLNSKDYGIPQNRTRLFVVGFRDAYKGGFSFPDPIPLQYTMQDFLEDYTESKYFLKQKGIKFVTSSRNRLKKYTQINGEVALCQKANQQFNWHGDFVFEPVCNLCQFDDFVFKVSEVEEKYYLSEKVKKYVLSEGTKTYFTKIKTDLPIARPLLQSMHKMHRAGIDNYVTHYHGRIRKLTPRECLRLMGFGDDFKIAVSDTQIYRQSGNSIVVDVLIAILKHMDVTRFADNA